MRTLPNALSHNNKGLTATVEIALNCGVPQGSILGSLLLLRAACLNIERGSKNYQGRGLCYLPKLKA